jgi:pyridoxal phosphate enzyme (YggS family)
MNITKNVKELIGELPTDVQLVAAAKGRRTDEILEAVEAGISIIGENYLQEVWPSYNIIDKRVKWHFIGHLQKNKVRKAVQYFDVIQTVDSSDLAIEISRKAQEQSKVMPIYVEINSGREPQKHGVYPENAETLIRSILSFAGIKVMGLMTMGPLCNKEEELQPFFAITKQVFDWIKRLDLPGVEMKYLSMGMSTSYKTALKEGANVIRIGTKIFEK